MGVAETARMLAALDLDDSKFQRGITRSLGGVGKLDKGLSRAGRGAGQLGGGLLKVGAVAAGAVAAGFAFAGKSAIDYDDAFQGVVKTVDASAAKFKELHGALLEMSTEMPTSATELANIAAAGGQMGVKANDIESFTKQVAILAETTNVSSDQAATALGQLQNVIGLTGAEFDNFAAALVDLGNKGSSTEADILEVERRAGGAAKLIGVAKQATLGWAAAAANLGLNQELAGTALQKFFIGAQQLVSKGGKGLTGFAKIAGVSAKDFAKAFQRNASGALDAFLNGLAKLPKDKRLKAIDQFFGKGTGMTRLLVGLSSSIKQNLDPALTDSAKAWRDATAAQAEFDKRNETVRSQLTRLWNTIKLGAVTVGEGFTPAIGRAADRLSKFIKDPENIAELKKIGEDIGDAIDKIDFDKLLTAAKNVGKALDPALQILLKMADVISKLPPEVLGAGAGFLVANKISGGAIAGGAANILQGLAGALVNGLAKAGIGRAFVQPVFVTNPGFGGAGGGVGSVTGGGAGMLAKLGFTASVIADIAGVVATQQQVSGESSQHASDVMAQLKANLNDPKFDVRAALNGVEQGINNLQANPLLVLVQGDALDQLKQMRQVLLDKLGKPGAPGSLVQGPPVPAVGTAGSAFYGPPKPTAPGAPGSSYYGPPVPKNLTVTIRDPAVVRAIEALRDRLVSISKREEAALRNGNKPEFHKLLDTEHELVRKGARHGDLTLWLGSLNRREAIATRTHNATWLGKLERKETEIRERIQAAAERGARATQTGTSGTTSAVNVAANRITSAVAAVAAVQPIVNVDIRMTPTGVQSATTTSNRYGPGTSKSGNNNDVHPGTP